MKGERKRIEEKTEGRMLENAKQEKVKLKQSHYRP
jgi:hypothetical protein